MTALGERLKTRVRKISFAAWIVIALTFIGALLRLKALTFQSLWLDELHTMLETAPWVTLSQIFAFLGSDPHPPLYFLLIHVWFHIVGYNDFTARLFSALLGSISIPVAYLLGKELYSKNAGIIFAAFTSFNYFFIQYSQEARNYTLACLATLVSFLFLIRAVRRPSTKSALFYTISALALVYTHYFGLLVFISQAVIATILWFWSQSKIQYLLKLGLAFLLVCIGYLPWTFETLTLSGRSSFWIQKPANTFFVSYFGEYFGKDAFSVYAFTFLLIVFFSRMIRPQKLQKEPESPFENSYMLAFIVLSVWYLTVYLIPYVRSLISVPILHIRYTIVALPAILLATAIGVDQFRNAFLKLFMVILVISFGLIHLFFYSRYYEVLSKTQWREMSEFFVTHYRDNVPVVSDRRWHLGYYFRKEGLRPEFVPEESVRKLRKVWVVTGHRGNPVSPKTQRMLDQNFEIKESFHGFDTWAILYARREPDRSQK